MLNWTGLSICLIAAACCASVSTSCLAAWLEQVDALLPRAGAEVAHRAGIVEHHGDFQRVFQPHFRAYRVVDVGRLFIDQHRRRRQEIGLVDQRRAELHQAAAGGAAGQRDAERGVGRIDTVAQVGLEELQRIGPQLVVGGAFGKAAGGGEIGGVERVHHLLFLADHARIVDAQRHGSHQRHHGEHGHEGIVAAPVAAEVTPEVTHIA